MIENDSTEFKTGIIFAIRPYKFPTHSANCPRLVSHILSMLTIWGYGGDGIIHIGGVAFLNNAKNNSL